jgi:hypothetical protein
MNVFVNMYGRVDTPIVVIPSENILKIEKMKQEQKTLVKEACFSVLAPRRETFFHVFHDSMTRYMENLYNQDLQRIVGCKLKDEGSEESVSLLKMGRFRPDNVLQPWMSCVSRNYYFHTSQQARHLLDGNQ